MSKPVREPASFFLDLFDYFLHQGKRVIACLAQRRGTHVIARLFNCTNVQKMKALYDTLRDPSTSHKLIESEIDNCWLRSE